MSDPIRLLASADATDLEKELLGSWKDEHPSAAARDKTLAMLGIAGGATAAAAGSLAPKAAATGWLAIAKWAALGAFVIGAAVGGTRLASHRTSAPPQEVVLPSALPRPMPVVVETPTPNFEPVVEVVAPPATHVARARVAPPASSSIEQQLAALDRARAALDEGEPARAERLVDAYEAEYSAGAFLQEAEVLRIESLVSEGRASDAERVAKRFFATYPKSPHGARVHSLLGYAP